MKTTLLVLLFLIYIFMILGVVFIERKNPTEAMLWVLVLIFLPYVGMLLYLAFGSTLSIRLTASIRKRRLYNRYDTKTLKHLLVQKRKSKASPLSATDREVIRFNEAYNESYLTYYKDATFFVTGESHYRQLFRDIQNAKESIHIEFYTIHHDAVGEAFVKALTARVKDGVEVLVMCDFIANLSTPKSMFAPLVEAGGKVKRLKPYLTHFRSHRKIVTIDGKIGYIGGMNIGKQYANLAKVKNPWRDTQIRLTGQCVQTLEFYYLTDWFCAQHKRDMPQVEHMADRLIEAPLLMGSSPCQFVLGGVDTEKESVKMCYLRMIHSAKTCIRIQTPYFIPDNSILDALKTAAASGVRIEIMIPGIKASFFLDPVTTYYVGALLPFGARVYKYNGYVHAKTMVIDDEICCIGSVNMDMRSLKVDDEICGVFYDNNLVQRYTAILKEDKQHCKRYTLQDFNNRTRKERLSESFFLLFAPLF